jgi:hypothetical protein
MGLIASACGDAAGTIKFWSLNKNQKSEDIEDDSAEVVQNKGSKKKRKTKETVVSNPEKAKRQSFFSDL